MWLFVSLLIGAVAAAAQYWVLHQLGVGPMAPPEFLVGSLAIPALAALLAAALRPKVPAAAPVTAEPAAPLTPPEPPENAALRLLAFLQEEGRLIDFLQEDVSPYTDEQIGAATRGIHASCAKALRDTLTLERIVAGSEDAAVTIESGFDQGAIRLTGNVGGTPPFHGVLRHGGWRASRIVVPARAGVDPAVIAPAEVEIA
jgi:hypothetical protein